MGLTVRATLLEGEYATGQRVSDTQMEQLNIEHTVICPQWNYTLCPRGTALSFLEEPAKPEVIF